MSKQYRSKKNQSHSYGVLQATRLSWRQSHTLAVSNLCPPGHVLAETEPSVLTS